MSDARDVIAKWLAREAHIAAGGVHPKDAPPDYRRADSILAALASAGIKCVGREPTRDMLLAAHLKDDFADECWHAMWDAAEPQETDPRL